MSWVDHETYLTELRTSVARINREAWKMQEWKSAPRPRSSFRAGFSALIGSRGFGMGPVRPAVTAGAHRH